MLRRTATGRPEAEPVTREQISRLRLPGQVKLHPRDQDIKRRSTITRAVAGYELEAFAAWSEDNGGVGPIVEPEHRRDRTLRNLPDRSGSEKRGPQRFQAMEGR